VASTTIEQGLREIVAEHDLSNFEIGFTVRDHGMWFTATAFWFDTTTSTGLQCTSGSGDTVDEAVNNALTAATSRRSVQDLAA
jgi:hypothetical protein